MQTRLKVIIGVGGVLVCGALLFSFGNLGSSNSETSTASTSKPYTYTTTSSKVNKSKAFEIAEKQLQKWVGNKFNTCTRIEIGSEKVADELSSHFVIEIKGNASGYVDEYNDDFNKMTFTFKIDVEKDGGYTKNDKFDYNWKY